MEIRSAFEFVEEGKVLRDAAGGDEQVAAVGGQAELVENPCGGFSEFTEDGEGRAGSFRFVRRWAWFECAGRRSRKSSRVVR